MSKQTVVEYRRSGIVKVIDWHVEAMKRLAQFISNSNRLVVYTDYHCSKALPKKVVHKGDWHCQGDSQPNCSWKFQKRPKVPKQWQWHLHQPGYMEKKHISPSPKNIDWNRIEMMYDLEYGY